MKMVTAILFFVFLALSANLAARKNTYGISNHNLHSPYRCAQSGASPASTQIFAFVFFRSEAHPIFHQITMRKNTNQPPYVAHEAVGGLYTLAEIQIKYKPKKLPVPSLSMLDLCPKGTDVAKLAYQLYDPADLAMGCKLLAVFMDKRRKTIAYRFMGDVNMHEPAMHDALQQVVSIAYTTFADNVTLVLNRPDGRITPCLSLLQEMAVCQKFLGNLGVFMDDFIVIGPDVKQFYSYQDKGEGMLWNQ